MASARIGFSPFATDSVPSRSDRDATPGLDLMIMRRLGTELRAYYDSLLAETVPVDLLSATEVRENGAEPQIGFQSSKS
jgi:hypothetical protein